MDFLFDLTMLQNMNALFWHRPFYAVFYIVCLLSLVVFKDSMKRGRRFFFLFSVLCSVFFIYNPVFVNLIEKYLLHTDRVVVRLFLLLPIMFTETYVITNLISIVMKKSKVLAVILTLAITSVLVGFGIAPWQRAANGWDSDMYILAENPYKIPQEHLDICEVILNDMDGERSILSLYEFHGINDIGGTLNYSIRMYTSRIQLNTVIDAGSYSVMTQEERTDYWTEYISEIQNEGTDNTSYYFLFPIGDERATDLIAYGCDELPVNSSNYQLLVFAP